MPRSIGLRGDGWVPVVIPELPWRVELYVGSVDGTPQVLGLKLEPDVDPEGRLKDGWLVRDAVINTQSLRRLPLTRLRQAAAELHRVQLAEVFKALRPPVRKPGQPLPSSHLEAVADLYRAAVRAEEPPLTAICKKWQVKRPTASRWVRAARDAGMLGWPTARGVSGFSADKPPNTVRDV